MNPDEHRLVPLVHGLKSRYFEIGRKIATPIKEDGGDHDRLSELVGRVAQDMAGQYDSIFSSELESDALVRPMVPLHSK